ncbi:MAG: nuclear transport factor 2 family protein, partial [Bacteroides sp.]|nr:nuclear transport factor 2 family protein [Bacteroides sp.]
VLSILLEAITLQATPVKFTINDGLHDAALKSRIEQNISNLLTEINNAQAEKRALKLGTIQMTQRAKESMAMLWENIPFRCDDDEVIERCLENRDGYQVRQISLILKPQDAGLQDDEYQEAVISFDRNGQITSFYLTIGINLYAEVMKSKNEVFDVRRRMQILDYVEQFRTSYNMKDINFLQQIFSDDALIITGTVVEVSPNERNNFTPSRQVTYRQQTKTEYLTRLKASFARNKYIRVTFDNIKVTAHPTKPEFYGVLLHQGYASSTYSDEGYLFLLWDFSNETAPKIHVRTWQPDYLDEAKTERLPEEDIFSIVDFDL